MKHEPITAASLHMKAIPSCSKCGGSNVGTPAFTRFNILTQSLRISEVPDDEWVCYTCGQETVVKWRLEK